MIKIKEYLDENFIGQESAKKKLNFCIQNQNKTGYIRPILFAAQRGYGKTRLSRLTGFNLKDSNNLIKKFIEINCSSVKNLGVFVSQVILPHVIDRDITILFDEIDQMDKSVKSWLLSVLALSDKNKSQAIYDSITYNFDFNRLSFISCTTNPEKLTLPFKSRFRRIDFEPYKKLDLVKILKLHTEKEIEFKDNIEEEIVEYSRGCPIILTEEIGKDLRNSGEKIINKKIWEDLNKFLGYKPLGLNNKELEILKYLKNTGPQTLTAISAFIGLDATTVRRDSELFLLSKNLIHIDGKRHLSKIGQELLEKLDKT